MVLLKKSAWIICIFLPLLAGAQRLPYGLSAKHYGLTFTPDLKQAAFSGDATIDVEVNKAANAFTLNAIELNAGDDCSDIDCLIKGWADPQRAHAIANLRDQGLGDTLLH